MSEFITLDHVNTPEPAVTFEPVDEELEHVTLEVDWQEMGQPTPQMFLDVHEIHSDVVVFLTNVDDADPEWMDEAEAVQDALDDLLDAMVDAREDLDADERADLRLGDLTVLPEVSE
jgi:hypothetical protein